MQVRDQLQRAIGAHGMWKARLRAALDGAGSAPDPKEVARDDACDFGRWLHNPSLPVAVRASPHYGRVKALHARFHICACAALRKALAADRVGLEADLRNDGAVGTASAELTREIMAWMRDQGQQAA